MKLLKFEKNDCKPCEQVGAYLDTREVAYETIKPYDTPQEATKYRVRTVPTLLLLDNEGKEVGRSIGFNPLEIDNLIKQL